MINKENGIQEIVARGVFKDGGCIIHTIVYRVTRECLNEYIFTEPHNFRDCYDTAEEYREYIKIVDSRKEAWENKMLDAFGWKISDGYGASFTQNVSEIFTAVLMEPDPNWTEGRQDDELS